MLRLFPTIAAVALALAFLSVPAAPLLSSSAYASKMNGNYGCSEGRGRCGGTGRGKITQAPGGKHFRGQNWQVSQPPR
jgi:hypothetical protein